MLTRKRSSAIIIHDSYISRHGKHILQGQTRHTWRHLREGGHGHTHHDEQHQEGLAGLRGQTCRILSRGQIMAQGPLRTIQTKP